MNLSLIFSIIFAFLVISCQSQTFTSESTTTASNDLTTTSESSGGASISTAEPAGPTESTLSPASQNPTVPTTAAPIIPTTEVPSTTIADIWAEFDLDCNTTANYCVYKINAPQIDAATFNEDSSKLQTEKDVYLKAFSKANYDSSSFFANEVYQNYQNVQELVQNLTMEMQALRDTVDEALADVQNQTASISDAYQAVKTIYSNLTTCYYQRCALVTPPPITTTTTLRPTTPNLCSDYPCVTPTAVQKNGTCSIVSSKPTCQCPGNLDQKNHCEQVGCYPSFSGLRGTVPGPIWSPGYTGSTPVSYGNNLNCVYQISSSKSVKITVNKIKLDPTANLYVNSNSIPKGITDPVQLGNYISGILNRTANSLATKLVTIKLTSKAVPSSGGPYYIDWNIVNY